MITFRHGLSSAGWRRSRRPLYLAISAVVILLVALAAGVMVLIHPLLPRRIVMATGEEGGAYAAFGVRYRQFFAREHVQLTVLHTSGSLDNLALLGKKKSGASVALVQSGVTSAQQSPELVSLGTVALEPLWIFYRGNERLDQLNRLRGRRVATGPVGSGMRKLALELLGRNGIDDANTVLLPLTSVEAEARLAAGTIDAALLVAAPEAPVVGRLLTTPNIRLMSLARAKAYVALYPYMTRVVLPAGFSDLAHDRPAANVELVAVKTNLVVRRDLQSAVQYLLLEAASQIHAQPGVFQEPGQFPAAEVTDLPLSADARQYYRSGPPLLQRNLPLWLAIFVEQLAITLLPVVAIAYPLLRTLPAVYHWGMRRRVYRLYGELKLLELALEEHRGDRHAAELSDLSQLEDRAAHLRVPMSFTHLLYMLRQDIGLVRTRRDQSTLTES